MLFHRRHAIYQLLIALFMCMSLAEDNKPNATTTASTPMNTTNKTNSENGTGPGSVKRAVLLSKRQVEKINIVTMTVSMIGALFNTAVVVAIIIDPLKILRKGPWITIFNLAIADLISCISNFCIRGGGFFHQSYDSIYMHTSHFGWGFGASASFLSLTFLSAQVYIVTKFPLKSRFIITNVKITLGSIVIFLISFASGLSQVAYLHYPDLHTTLNFYVGYFGVLELAVLIQVILNVQIIMQIMRSRRRAGKKNSHNNKHTYIAKTVAMLTLILFFTAFPYFVLKQMAYFVRLGYFGERETARWFYHASYIYLPITMLNFSANPILYSLRLPEYKRTLLAVFRKATGKVGDPLKTTSGSARQTKSSNMDRLRGIYILSLRNKNNSSQKTACPLVSDDTPM